MEGTRGTWHWEAFLSCHTVPVVPQHGFPFPPVFDQYGAFGLPSVLGARDSPQHMFFPESARL